MIIVSQTEGPASTRTLLQVGLFAAMLASAGLPLYIHLPRYAVGEMGLSLSTLGAVLIAMRFFDLAQDPVIGRTIDRFPDRRSTFAAAAAAGLALGFAMLFVVAPPIHAVVWLVLSLAVLFTAFSTATILIYGQGVTLAGCQKAARFTWQRPTRKAI